MPFNSFTGNNFFPNKHFLITPSDTVGFTPGTGLVYAGGAGTISAVDDSNQALPYTVVAGDILPIVCTRVNATGTSAAPLYLLRGA